MSALRFLLLTLFLGVVVGCGGEERKPVEPPPPTAKAVLQDIATTGNLSAKQAELKQELEGMGESDPEKAEELLADFEQLITLKNAAEIKAKAQEMADKL